MRDKLSGPRSYEKDIATEDRRISPAYRLAQQLRKKLFGREDTEKKHPLGVEQLEARLVPAGTVQVPDSLAGHPAIVEAEQKHAALITVETQANTLQKDILTLTDTLKAGQMRAGALQSQLTTDMQSLQAAETEEYRLQLALQTLKTTFAGLSDRKGVEEQRAGTLQTEIQGLTEALTAQKKQMESAQAALTALDASIAGLQMTMTAQSAAVTAREKDVALRQTAVTQADTILQQAMRDEKSANAALTSARSAANAAELQLQKDTASYTQAMNTLTALQKSRDQIQQQISRGILVTPAQKLLLGIVNAAITNATAQVQEKKTAMMKSQAASNAAKKLVTVVGATVSTAAKKIADADKIKAQAQSLLSAGQNALTGARAARDKTGADLTSMQGQRKDLAAKNGSAQSAIAGSEATLAAKQASLKQTHDSLPSLIAEIAATQKDIESVTASLTVASALRQQRAATRDAAHAALDAVFMEMGGLQKTLEQERQELAKAEQEMRALTVQVTTADAALSALVTQEEERLRAQVQIVMAEPLSGPATVWQLRDMLVKKEQQRTDLQIAHRAIAADATIAPGIKDGLLGAKNDEIIAVSKEIEALMTRIAQAHAHDGEVTLPPVIGKPEPGVVPVEPLPLPVGGEIGIVPVGTGPIVLPDIANPRWSKESGHGSEASTESQTSISTDAHTSARIPVDVLLPDIAILRQPAHGTLQSVNDDGRTGSALIYTPAPGFSGTDTFQYRTTEHFAALAVMIPDGKGNFVPMPVPPDKVSTTEVLVTVNAPAFPLLKSEDIQPKLLSALEALKAVTGELRTKADSGLLTVEDILGPGAAALSPTHALAISALQGIQAQLQSDILDHLRTRDVLLAAGGDHTADLAALDAMIADLVEHEQAVEGQAAALRYATTVLTVTESLSPELQAIADNLRAVLHDLESHSPVPRRSAIDVSALREVMHEGQTARAQAGSAVGTVYLRSWKGVVPTPTSITGGQNLLLHGAVSAIDLGQATGFVTGLSGTLRLAKAGGSVTLHGYRGEDEVSSVTVRDGETFSFSDGLGMTSVVVLAEGQSDVTFENLSVINRRDLQARSATSVDIMTNRDVAIGSANPPAFDNGGATWWKKKVGNYGNGINSPFGYYMPIDSSKYSLHQLRGDGNARFYGTPVSIHSEGENPRSTPLDPARYDMGDKTLIIYPGAPGVIWVQVASFGKFTMGGKEGDSYADILPPEGAKALEVGLVNRRAQGQSGWGEHHDAVSGQQENAVGGFQGVFTVLSTGSDIRIDQVLVHSGQTGTLADPVVGSLAGTTIRGGQILDLSIGVNEGQTVDGVRPRWTIGFIVNGQEVAMTNGTYRYPYESGKSAAFNDSMWKSSLPTDKHAAYLKQKITTTLQTSGDNRIAYGQDVTNNYQVAIGGGATPVQVLSPSQLPPLERALFLQEFLGAQHRDTVMSLLLQNYLRHTDDLSLATQMAQMKFDLAIHNPDLLLGSINLDQLGRQNADTNSVLLAVADALVPEGAEKVVGENPGPMLASANFMTDSIIGAPGFVAIDATKGKLSPQSFEWQPLTLQTNEVHTVSFTVDQPMLFKGQVTLDAVRNATVLLRSADGTVMQKITLLQDNYMNKRLTVVDVLLPGTYALTIVGTGMAQKPFNAAIAGDLKIIAEVSNKPKPMDWSQTMQDKIDATALFSKLDPYTSQGSLTTNKVPPAPALPIEILTKVMSQIRAFTLTEQKAFAQKAKSWTGEMQRAGIINAAEIISPVLALGALYLEASSPVVRAINAPTTQEKFDILQKAGLLEYSPGNGTHPGKLIVINSGHMQEIADPNTDVNGAQKTFEELKKDYEVIHFRVGLAYDPLRMNIGDFRTLAQNLLIARMTETGPFKGKTKVTDIGMFGYSWGGGQASVLVENLRDNDYNQPIHLALIDAVANGYTDFVIGTPAVTVRPDADTIFNRFEREGSASVANMVGEVMARSVLGTLAGTASNGNPLDASLIQQFSNAQWQTVLNRLTSITSDGNPAHGAAFIKKLGDDQEVVKITRKANGEQIPVSHITIDDQSTKDPSANNVEGYSVVEAGIQFIIKKLNTPR